MYGYIYKFTFIPTGKFYIGKHRYEDKNLLDENYWGSGTYWTKVINDYIKLNNVDYNSIISREILEWCDTKEDLNNREQYWIKELDALNEDIAYNLASGGNGGTGKGCVWYNNGKKEFYVNELIGEVPDTSWNKGRLKENLQGLGLGYIWVNNGLIQKCCPKDEVNKYLNLGWVKGMLYRGDSWRANCGHEISEEQKLICRLTAKRTLAEGKNPGWFDNQFKKGSIPFNKDKYWITNGIKNKYISYGEEIPDGWYKGCTQKKKSRGSKC